MTRNLRRDDAWLMLIEINTFRLADAVDEAAFLEVDERVRTGFLYHQPGLVRATTAKGEDGEWAVILLWESDELADASAAQVANHPAFVELHGLLDESTLQQRKYTTFD